MSSTAEAIGTTALPLVSSSKYSELHEYPEPKGLIGSRGHRERERELTAHTQPQGAIYS